MVPSPFGFNQVAAVNMGGQATLVFCMFALTLMMIAGIENFNFILLGTGRNGEPWVEERRATALEFSGNIHRHNSQEQKQEQGVPIQHYVRERNKTYFFLPGEDEALLLANETANDDRDDPLLLSVHQEDQHNADVHPDEQPHRITYTEMLKRHPAFRKSPFELSSDEWLPSWAHKQTRRGEISIPRGRHVCLAHVGKAGGSTLGCSLGFQLHCRGTKMRSGVLPLYTTNVMHNGMNDCPRHMPYYLFTLRNPIDRARSAYVYDRPTAWDSDDAPRRRHEQDDLYNDCPFKTLNDLAVNGLDTQGTASKRCRERAVKAIRGMERHGYHLYFNYGWFVNETEVFANESLKTNTTSQILVIRSEHMTQDWQSAEAVLRRTNEDDNDKVSSHNNNNNNAENTAVEEFPHRNPSSWKAVDSDNFLSQTALRALCYHLCPEIQLYKKLLLRAVNLDYDDFIESMNELHTSCPDQVTAVSCPALKVCNEPR